MNYVAHPYASASAPDSSPSKSATLKSRPQRPKITTLSSSPASFFDSTSPADTTRSPSPITFARASVVSPLQGGLSFLSSSNCSGADSERTIVRQKDEKKDRRRGLMAAERGAHAGLDALLRVPEAASARAAQQPRMPHVQLVRSPTNLSVTPSIVLRSSPSTVSRCGNESDSSAGSSSRTPAPCGVSPTPSSGSGSEPSTPGQPRTPVSVSFGHDFSFYPTVAPLSICKANRTPSPSAPSKLPSVSTELPSSSSICKENLSSNSDVSLRKRRSRGRFSARTTSLPRAEQLFALEVDTSAVRSLDTSHEPPTLTGVLEEFEREALNVPPVPPLPVERRTMPEKDVKEENDNGDESEWLDVAEDDPLEDAEYYRADIASHLQLFSSSSYPLTRTPSYTRHRRGGSNSSVSSVSRWQLPPARPDSMPPPPQFFSVFTFEGEGKRGSAPTLPPLPPLPALPIIYEGTQFHSLRRPSTSSLASTGSCRSNRSSGSTSSKSKHRSSRNSRHSIARRSAALGVGRRRSGNTLKASKPLPPLPGVATNIRGPSPTLDPTYMELARKENEDQSRIRPPPRFSIPISVDEEDFIEDSGLEEIEARNGMETRMTSLLEEDEDEDGLIDPFVLDRFPMVGASSIALTIQNDFDREVDPFTTPLKSSHSTEPDVPLSPSTISPSSRNKSFSPQSQPFILIPECPAPSSSFGGSNNDSFDAESLYSSYAAFSPGCGSNSSDNSSVALNSGSDNSTETDDAQSIFLDSSGRPLQSRWSVSTFASAAPPSSARSFFQVPKLVSTVPSRLSARLRAARERAVQQAKEREVKEPVVRPFPFFPTPTPPSPKRKTNPGPGKYVPKPELMPPKVRAGAEKASMSAKSPTTSVGSPRSSCETVRTVTTTSSSSTASTTSSRPSSMKSKESTPSSFKVQFAQYRTYRNAPAHAGRLIPPSSSTASSTSSCSSPPRSLKSQNSADSLSAFPFTLAGENLTALALPARSNSNCSTEAAGERRTESERHDSGLKRKCIPPELFV